MNDQRKGVRFSGCGLLLVGNFTEASMPFPFQDVFCILAFLPILYILTSLRYISIPHNPTPLHRYQAKIKQQPNLLSVTLINRDISNRHPTLQSIRRLTIWHTRKITSHSDIQDREKFPMGHVLPLHAPIRVP